jgi:hypothetical protein
MKTVLASILVSASSFVTLANASTNNAWTCRDTIGAMDNSFNLHIVQNENETVSLVELEHISFIGGKIVSKMNVCTTTFPAPGVADGSVDVSCHDGLWSQSKKVEISLGGFLPTIGTAQLFENGPENYELTQEFTCRLNLNK